MKGRTHKLLGLILFSILYFFNGFPTIINSYLHNNFIYVLIGFTLTFLFSGGRIKSKRLWDFGLSADNDYHKKMKRDWLMHSAIIPTLLIFLIPHPIVLISCFFYVFHIACDLLNTHSWEGNKYTYIAVFITVILFYIIFYS